MGDFDDVDFGGGSSGASQTYPAQCSSLRKGGFVVIKGRPCKIVEMSTSKTGKHGHAKVHLVALDIFTQKKYEDICPSTHNMNVPNVQRRDFQLCSIDDDYLDLLSDDGEQKADCKVPDGPIGEEIKKKYNAGDSFMCTVLESMGEEAVVGVKAMTK